MSDYNRTNEAEYVCKILDEYKNLNVETYHKDIRQHIERKYEIDLAMNRLSPRQNKLLRLTNIAGMSNKYVAIRLGISKKNVEGIKCKAYRNLYQILINDKSIPYEAKPTTYNQLQIEKEVRFSAYITRLNLVAEIAKRNNDRVVMENIDRVTGRIDTIVKNVDDNRKRFILEELLKQENYMDIAKKLKLSTSQIHYIRANYLSESIEQIKIEIKDLLNRIITLDNALERA